MPEIHLINNVTTAEKVIYRILEDEPIVGFACKGIEIGPHGTITLIAISTPSGDVYIFDIRADQNILLNGGLVRLIESVDNVKVMHSSQLQASCLFKQFKVRLKQVFDTQEKYGDVMVKRGLPRRLLSLPALLERYNIDYYKPTAKLQRLLREDRNVWSRRPLTKDILNTAASEVLPLVPSLYVTLFRCLGLHESQPENNSNSGDKRESAPITPVSTPRTLPVVHTRANNPLKLPTNYLHIHVTP
ncbi:hypothetical protein LOTGIDRAFT_161292 [Lottia gigantea]|uniref:3'-5' exonuclease domain-containing protein n=1 Tax=Lottia gigantea TaxID=225164 RepID=V4BZL7_LOTGI|nr:hypothetical protein LOTGIDRAFT_161292 [Lottia gigantea]ESO94589.1 hypothetical protein LOTGIDRAFT_161292 [Lottia gigantea]